MGQPGEIAVAVRDDVAVLTLNRPDKLNALTAAMRRELAAALRRLGPGDEVRGIVVTGAGRAFSAGQDLPEAAASHAGLVAEVELFHDLTRATLETRIPVVAAVNGIAVGGGCEMTLCMDSRIGTPEAGFLLPEQDIGLSISNAASVLLPRLVGNRAVRMVMEPSRIGATEAVSLGLLDEIVEQPELVGTAVDLVHRWTMPGAATRAHLGLLRPPPAMVEEAFTRETEAVRLLEESGVARSGIERFLRTRSR